MSRVIEGTVSGAAMSLKHNGKFALREYSSLEDESVNNDQSDVDYEVMSNGRSGRSAKNEGSLSSGGKNGRGGIGNRGSSKRPSLSRNAFLARENRRRKKEYLEKMENKVSYLKEENKSLSNKVQRQDIDLKRLKGEVSYLRNVLNNSSSIINLLRSINESLSTRKACGREISSNRKYHDGNSKGLPRNEWIAKPAGGKLCEATAGGTRERLSRGDSDHTYTMSSRDDFEGSLSSLENEQKHRDLFNNDSFTLKNDFDLDLDRLPQFDEDIFNSIGNFDENPSNDLEHYTSTKSFDNLDNSGICLHINSGQVSLEFCSICHRNNVNNIE